MSIETWGPAVFGPDVDHVYGSSASGGFGGFAPGGGGGPSITSVGTASVGAVSLSSMTVSAGSPWLIGTTNGDALVRDSGGQVVGWRFRVDTPEDGKVDMLVPLAAIPEPEPEPEASE